MLFRRVDYLPLRWKGAMRPVKMDLASFFLVGLVVIMNNGDSAGSDLGSVEGLCLNGTVEPLGPLSVTAKRPGEIQILDAALRCYHQTHIEPGRQVCWLAGGAAGRQVVRLRDQAGGLVAERMFRLVAKTNVVDGSGRMTRLLRVLLTTMLQSEGGGGEFISINDTMYKFYICWLRDHVHALKGLRYFDGVLLPSGIDLYADFQRADGMIWDRVGRGLWPYQTWRDHEFADGGFIRTVPGNPQARLERIPVENDVEYLFIEGLYLTWQATGDDAWMGSLLDRAIRAVGYATSDPCRWSSKFELLKRGYTIDTWDFQHEEDAAIGGSAMRIDPQRTRFGVMHGDNTGMAAALGYLAEMLMAVGRRTEAHTFQDLSRKLMRRVVALAWNGDFFTHFVDENPGVKRDVGGTRTAEQITLSNAYALGRGITHDQAVKIIRSYQQVRQRMPASSPGEFYNCYPPFEKGFENNSPRWEYMNGGVSPIVAGELARGAFQHGFASYGADILNRMLNWAEAHGGMLPCCLKGKMPDSVAANYHPLDLRPVANADFRADSQHTGVLPWLGETGNDLAQIPTGRQRLNGVDFDIIDPDRSAGRSCLILGGVGRVHQRACVASDRQTAQSIYLLHACSNVGTEAGVLVGWLTLHYTNGTHQTRYIQTGREVGSWFMPGDSEPGRNHALRLAWRGANAKFKNVGVYTWGMAVDHPEAALERVEFTAAESATRWMVLGLTLSDQPLQVPVSEVSYGIPAKWGAAAVVRALMEGLVGVTDRARAMDVVELAPRWAATDETYVDATAAWPASEGYVAYQYRYDRPAKMIEVLLTGSGQCGTLKLLLLPEAATVRRVLVDDSPAAYTGQRIENSRYVFLVLPTLSPQRVRVEYG